MERKQKKGRSLSQAQEEIFGVQKWQRKTIDSLLRMTSFFPSSPKHMVNCEHLSVVGELGGSATGAAVAIHLARLVLNTMQHTQTCPINK